MAWREYHEFTKHSVQSLRRNQYVLDWKNMPDPFRHYEGVPVLDLPADPPSPEIPALELLRGAWGAKNAQTTASDGPEFLSQLLFYSASISASKLIPSTGDRYALRVNPSSGNLHPTEFHFVTRGLKQWPDGLYHYRPSSHMAEQRATGDLEAPWIAGATPIVFILTSIRWREAWKYRDRAYRYCLNDIGHAWQALALAARSMGCVTSAVQDFPDDEVARHCRLSDDEWPMLILELKGESIPVREPDNREIIWYGGEANQLSAEIIDYPSIEAIHRATKTIKLDTLAEAALTGSGEIKLPAPASSTLLFGAVARKRRSALDFVGGAQVISLAQLSAILSTTSSNFIQLYLYAHRVDGLECGVYRYWPECAQLELIKSGDQRVAAAGLSLGQDLAGNASVAFSMIGDLDRAVRAHGDRGYRYVHFEAGAIGQRLYLAAEALGLGATGIGAFFDNEVHRYLNLKPEPAQVAIYHFAIGYPIPDYRVVA
jgi:SagB-type dehydrogenase family enzyme